MNKSIPLYATALFLTATTSAHAVLVTNQTTTTVIFNSNGYESPDAPGSAPSSATIGTYLVTAGKDYVDDAVTPGASSGSNFLTTVRDAGGSGHVRHVFTAAPGEDETITAEFMLFLPAGAGDHRINLGAALPNVDGFTSTTYRGAIRTANASTVTYTQTNGAFTATNQIGVIPLLRGQWQHWLMEYTRGSGEWSVSVDGSAPAVMPTITTDSGSHSYFISFSHSGLGTFHVDSVPEPSSVGLVAAAAALMWRRTPRQGGAEA